MVNYGTFKLYGCPSITGNVRGGAITNGTLQGGTADNVFINHDYAISHDWAIKVVGALDSAASVGVGLWENYDNRAPGVFATGLLGNGTMANFTSDDDAYHMYMTEEGAVGLCEPKLYTFTSISWKVQER